MTPDEIHELPAAEQGPVDVLIVTSLQDELTAVLALGEGGRSGWRDLRDRGGFPYHRRSFPSARGGVLAVAAAWIGEMGERTAAIRGQQLLTELDPGCLAMCGICAGYREKVALGDVIVADRLYSYEEGKRVAAPGKEAELFHDLRTFDLQATWKMDAALLARELDLSALSRERPPSKEAQRRWLLHTLHAHEAEGGAPPTAHPDRARACPAWTDRLKGALQQGLVVAHAGRLALTEQGREMVLTERLYHPDGLPADPPLRVHVGAIATGKVVQEDAAIFDHLRRLVRGTLGLEMEGSAIGDLATRFEKRSIVMKAVSDHADLDKDDSFRRFACHASATVLLAFLQKHLEPEQRSRRESPRRHALRGGDELRLEAGEPLLDERRDGFLARVEGVALLRDPEARVTRHEAPPPFAGVLTVAVRDGRLIKERVIGALEQPITEALFRQYQAEVEFRFRQENPFLRSTLIHTGPLALPRLLEDAARRGVSLKTFAEYQGLIDFTRYLEWQTRRLEADTVYPPWLYVEQPARLSLADRREEQRIESAIGALWDLLDAPHPRFALVLGDFGAGKTFLLHELARRMAKDEHPAVPVLVEMSRLEKQRSLKALLAQHFAMADMGRIDLDAFLYMLAEGRVALLFDGFDELALRLTYDRAEEHFETVLQAAQGNAKVVMTSRTQHFLTDQQIRRALALRAEQVPGYRLFSLERFGEQQIRRFLGNLIQAPEEAEERYRLLGEVKDLLGLSQNPRMLGFIAKIEPARLREAKAQSGEITAAKLYEVLIEQWLDFEHARVNPPGAPRGIARDKLGELVSKLAVMFWERNAKALEINEFRGMLVAEGVEPAVVEHMIGSGSLLVRDAEGRFSFVHQSVLEWLVAREAAEQIKRSGDATCLGQQEMSDLMADFFNALAGREIAWRRVIGQMAIAKQEIAKKNALRIERRLRDAGDDAPQEERGVDTTRDLEGQDLRGQDFSGADLVGANLRGADLSDATLVGADLTGANLQDAKLARADLSRARLGKADLRGADLWQARLFGADLRGSILRGAKLQGAKLIKAQVDVINGSDLSGATLLAPEGIEHVVASTSASSSVAFSPDGVLLASGHSDGTVRLWDAVTGKALRVLEGHKAGVLSVAFSPDGLTLASGSDDKTVILWNVATGTALHVLKGHQDYVVSVAFSPAGFVLASASGDTTVILWNVDRGKAFRVLEGHKARVLSVAFSPDGFTLASASDTSVILWSAVTGEKLRVLEGHKDDVLSVAFSPDGLALASGSDDKTITLWNVATGTALRTLQGQQGSVLSVAFSPDGLTLASASGDTTVILWNVATGTALRTLQGHQMSVLSVAFSPDSRTLASGSDDKIITLWNVASGTALRVLQGHRAHVRSVAFAPDGLAFASASVDKTVTLWNVAMGTALRVLEGHKDDVVSVAFSPDRVALASSSNDKTVILWSVATGTVLGVLEGHKAPVRSVAFSPDGLTLASASNDSTVSVWNVATGMAFRVLKGHRGPVRSVAFSPDGLTLASADTVIIVWNVATGTALRVLVEGHRDYVRSVVFAPDGRSLASASDDRTVILWNVATGEKLRVLQAHKGYVWSVAFAPDGRSLASASDDRTVILWDAHTGKKLRILEGHQARIRSVAFSPDGLTLASGSDDGTVRLWEVATGALLATYLKLPEGWVTFTPDGRYKLGGDIAGAFWHVIGLCRFEPGELDPYLDKPLRLPDT